MLGSLDYFPVYFQQVGLLQGFYSKVVVTEIPENIRLLL